MAALCQPPNLTASVNSMAFVEFVQALFQTPQNPENRL